MDIRAAQLGGVFKVICRVGITMRGKVAAGLRQSWFTLAPTAVVVGVSLFCAGFTKQIPAANGAILNFTVFVVQVWVAAARADCQATCRGGIQSELAPTRVRLSAAGLEIAHRGFQNRPAPAIGLPCAQQTHFSRDAIAAPVDNEKAPSVVDR